MLDWLWGLLGCSGRLFGGVDAGVWGGSEVLAVFEGEFSGMWLMVEPAYLWSGDADGAGFLRGIVGKVADGGQIVSLAGEVGCWAC